MINFSVPGYNTAQELELIKEKVLKFNPDLVILFFCFNDIQVCNYIKPDITFFNYLFHKSYLCHFILRNIDTAISSKGDENLKKFWTDIIKKKVLGMFYYDQRIYPCPGLEYTSYIEDGNLPMLKKNAPKKYWHMMGYENYKINLRSIYDLLKANNIIFISTGWFTAKAYAINQEIGINYICNVSREKYKRGVNSQDIVLSKEDLHFNVKGHRFMAEILHEFLKEKII